MQDSSNERNGTPLIGAGREIPFKTTHESQKWLLIYSTIWRQPFGCALHSILPLINFIEKNTQTANFQVFKSILTIKTAFSRSTGTNEMMHVVVHASVQAFVCWGDWEWLMEMDGWYKITKQLPYNLTVFACWFGKFWYVLTPFVSVEAHGHLDPPQANSGAKQWQKHG